MDLADQSILVADDDPGIRLLLVTFLRHQGFRAVEARNGREALEEMRAGSADLVILDLAMPEVSGLDVLRARADDPLLRRIPVIVVTATRREATPDLVDEQAWAVLAKPFDLDALLTTVRACMEEHPDVPHPLAA